MYKLEITHRLAGRKLGSILQSEYLMSRRLIRQLRECDGVLRNGLPTYLSVRVAVGEVIEVTLPSEASDVLAYQMPLDIRYEDDEVVVVNKPTGLLTHPTAREREASMLGGLRTYLGATCVPHAVHRLDRDTSGLVMFAKHAHTHHLFDIALRADQIDRQYVAIVYIGDRDQINNTWQTIDAPIAQNPDKPSRRLIDATGQAAITHYRTIASTGKIAVVHLKLDTGRTHQIRLHLASIGLPILGDRDYTIAMSSMEIPRDAQSYSRFMLRQGLHAFQLAWVHPIDKAEHVVTAGPPADMTELWTELGGATDTWEKLLHHGL